MKRQAPTLNRIACTLHASPYVFLWWKEVLNEIVFTQINITHIKSKFIWLDLFLDCLTVSAIACTRNRWKISIIRKMSTVTWYQSNIAYRTRRKSENEDIMNDFGQCKNVTKRDVSIRWKDCSCLLELRIDLVILFCDAVHLQRIPLFRVCPANMCMLLYSILCRIYK